MGFVHIDGYQHNVKRSDCLRPDNTSVIVILLDGGRDHSGHANAVAAHLHRAALAVFIEHGRVHGVTVFASELKDVTDFNSSGNTQCAATGRARIAGHGIA